MGIIHEPGLPEPKATADHVAALAERAFQVTDRLLASIAEIADEPVRDVQHARIRLTRIAAMAHEAIGPRRRGQTG